MTDDRQPGASLIGSDGTRQCWKHAVRRRLRITAGFTSSTLSLTVALRLPLALAVLVIMMHECHTPAYAISEPPEPQWGMPVA